MGEIQTRFESKRIYELARKDSFAPPYYESVNGYLALRKPKSPLATIELDEDSFLLAYWGWSSFVEHALGHYASRNGDEVATVYTYMGPSGNNSRGEQHRKLRWHNAVFFGVAGPEDVLDAIRLALVGGAGVPDDVMASHLEDANKAPQIHCAQSPDYIAFNRSGQASFHVEDGLAWSPYEQNMWYTNPDWVPAS